MTTTPDPDDLVELHAEEFDLDDPDTPVDRWQCIGCRAFVGFLLDDTDDQPSMIWVPAWRHPATGDLYCEDCGRPDVDRFLRDLDMVSVTMPRGQLNFLWAFLMTHAIGGRHKLEDPEYGNELGLRESTEVTVGRLLDAAAVLRTVLDEVGR